MALHFTQNEFAQRQRKMQALLNEQNLDGILLFRQESMYYLTGYDTFGYVFFQCLYMGANGDTVLLTRRPDLLQARLTSVISDVRVWVDGPDANPALELKAILQEMGVNGKRIGVEYESYGLTGRNCKRLEAALDGFCTLVDASMLVSSVRLVKSEAEITYIRRAAELADLALDEAHRLAKPGADEAHILAAMQSAIISGGGDDPANEFIIGSGPEALMVRYHSGRRKLAAQDQLMIEFAGVYRHYHACLMRTIPIGSVNSKQQEMHRAGVAALQACHEVMRPGHTVGDIFSAHCKVFDEAGFKDQRMNACGYSLGTTFAPNWMDWPMIYRDNEQELAPGMVFFLHMILLDDQAGLAMSPGHTVLITESGPEVLSKRPLDLIIG